MSMTDRSSEIEERWAAEDREHLRVDEDGCWAPPGRDGWGLGETLRRRRELLGLSQGEVSWRSGVDQSDVSRVESGGGVRWLTLLRLAEALECEAVFRLRPKTPLGDA